MLTTLSPVRLAVLTYLHDTGRATAPKIAADTGYSVGAVRDHLASLVAQDKVVRSLSYPRQFALSPFFDWTPPGRTD